MLHEYSPTEIFIKAIKDALDNDYLNIATNEENFIKEVMTVLLMSNI